MKNLTPQEIVRELDRYIVGQTDAKRAVAIAMRNRYRRLALPEEQRAEIMPKNILMIGPTGVGKTEIARRLAKLADAPFVKVEATKFTQVGYVGRDVDAIARDLMDAAVNMVHDERVALVRERAAQVADKRIVEILARRETVEEATSELRARASASSTKARANGVAVATQTTSASGPAAKAKSRRPSRKALEKTLADQLARNELDEQIIEIELEQEENLSAMFEFVSDLSDDPADGFQELLNAMPSGRKRLRRVSVKDARRLLTQEEANKLIDPDAVVEQATQRAEQTGIVFLDEIDKIVGSKVDTGPRCLRRGRPARPAADDRGHDDDDALRPRQDGPRPLDRGGRVLEHEALRPDSRAAGPSAAACRAGVTRAGGLSAHPDAAGERADAPVHRAAGRRGCHAGVHRGRYYRAGSLRPGDERAGREHRRAAAAHDHGEAARRGLLRRQRARGRDDDHRRRLRARPTRQPDRRRGP